MIDISTVGASITITFEDGGTPIEITEFSDEGTPFTGGDTDVSTNAKNLNGQMISSRTPQVYPVSLTVIPGSDSDWELAQRLQKAAIQPDNITNVSELKVKTLVINVPEIDESGTGKVRRYTYSNGRMKSGPTGPTSSAQGRMGARTYSFEFEKYAMSGRDVGGKAS